MTQTPASNSKAATWLMALLVIAAVVLAYQPVWHAGYIWDDDHHVTRHELRSLHGLVQIWTQIGATQQYYPLVHSVFWVEYKIWGDAAAPYHWVNILLHAVSALLLAAIVRRLQVPGAWLAAALFALHPVEVESVAWVSELKNTLSTVFYLGAALAYLKFQSSNIKSHYAASLLLFLFALMSKTVVATLPAGLLVVIWWQRGSLGLRRDVLPLAPFFIAGIGGGLGTAWVEQKFIGAEGAGFHFSFIERCLIAGRDIWFYLGKLAWPVNLVAIYPRWDVSQTVWWQYLYPAAAVGLLGLLAWRRWRGALAAMLFFVGTLFPALGFFNVYPFRFSFVADHFQYLASVGPLTLAAAGLSGFIRKKKPILEPMICPALLLFLGTLTWQQCTLYTDGIALWQKTIRQNPGSWLAHLNLGAALAWKGQDGEAVKQFREAVRLQPDYAEAWNNLGTASRANGKLDEAIGQFREALRLESGFARAAYNLGLALEAKGQTNEAIRQYKETIRLRPDFAAPHNSLGLALEGKGQMDEAIREYQETVRLTPDDAEARYSLGTALGGRGQIEEAIQELREAIRLKRDFAAAHNNLGTALGFKGRIAEAIQQYQEAVRLKPKAADFHNNLGSALMQAGHMDEAIEQFREALRLSPNFSEARDNLERALKMKSANR